MPIPSRQPAVDRPRFPSLMRWLPLGLGIVSVLAGGAPNGAQTPEAPGENCVVSAFNRTAPVQADGSWVLPDVPTSLGPIVVPKTTAETHPDPFCRSADGSTATWIDISLSSSTFSDINTVRDFVETLRRRIGVPLSFVEGSPGEFFSFPDKEMSLDEVLKAIAGRHGHYRCQAVAGRLVLRSSDQVFDAIVADVDLVDVRRQTAIYEYIKHLRSYDKQFEDWGYPLWAGVVESPVFQGLVTLAPRASLVEHLVQLLGRDDSAYFDIPAAHQSRTRTIDIHVVTKRREGGEE